jgi:hypothetical protein
VREFVQVLKLHRDHPARRVEQAVAQALKYGCPHLEGVRLCLHALEHPEQPHAPVDLTAHPELATVAEEPPDVRCYDQLLAGGVR